MKRSDSQKIIDFLHEAEKLKTLLRHSWLSSSRRESVAEHTWRTALMAVLLHSYLEKPVDVLKVLKMILVHDLVEINYKDNPAFKKQPEDKSDKERSSLLKLLEPLPKKIKVELMALWEEYELGESAEAKFAVALDKNEVLLQHNIADAKWLTKKEITYNFEHGNLQSEYDSFLKEFRQLVKKDTLRQYKKFKINKQLYKDCI